MRVAALIVLLVAASGCAGLFDPVREVEVAEKSLVDRQAEVEAREHRVAEREAEIAERESAAGQIAAGAIEAVRKLVKG